MDYLIDCLYSFAMGVGLGAGLFVLGGIGFVVMPFIFDYIGNPIARSLGSGNIRFRRSLQPQTRAQ